MPQNYNISDAMLSYSRRDKEFVKHLEQAIRDAGREIWVDWEDITGTIDWWAEIKAGIEAAHSFIFVITPNSIRSDVCRQEIDHAVKNGKRIIPIMRQDPTEQADQDRMHPVLRQHNWIGLRETDNFQDGVKSLIKTLETDVEHARAHTRLLVRANEWENNGHRPSLLLRGDDLTAAEAWLAGGIEKEPSPTALQAKYIAASRKATTRNRQTVLGAAIVTMLLLGFLSLLAWNQSIRAVDSEARALTAAAIAGTKGADAETQAALVVTAAGRAEDSEKRAYAAQTQAEIANQAAGTKAAEAQENQIQANEAATQAAENQLTADAAGTRSGDIQTTADFAATAAAAAQATAEIEAANLQLTSDMAATDAALANTQAADAQRRADISKASADTAATSAAMAQGTAVAQGTAAAIAKSLSDAQGTVAANQLATQQKEMENAQATASKVAVLVLTANAKGTQVAFEAQTLNLLSAARSALSVGDRGLAMHLALLAVARPGAPKTPSPLIESAFSEILHTTGVYGQAWEGHTGAVTSVAFSPDGAYVVSGSLDKTVRIWNAATGQNIKIFVGHTLPVNSVAFSPDGTQIASGSEDRTLRIWEVSTGKLLQDLSQGAVVTSVAYSPKDKCGVLNLPITCVVVGLTDGRIKIWNPSTGVLLFQEQQPHHTNDIASVAFSDDGNYLVSAGWDSQLLLWTWDAGVNGPGAKILPMKTSNTAATDRLMAVAFSPDSQYIVGGSWDTSLRLWNTTTGMPSSDTMRDHQKYVSSVDINPMGNLIVSGSEDQTLRLWDLRSGMLIGQPMTGHTGPVRSVAFSPDGSRIVSGSDDKTVRFWDTGTGESIGGPLIGHEGRISGVAFNFNGKQIASVGWDDKVLLWDLSTDPPSSRVLGAHDLDATGVAFSPDGTRVVSGAWDHVPALPQLPDRVLLLWNVNTGTFIRALVGHTERVTSVAFSPDGKFIVSGSWDRTLRLWDANTGALLRTFTGHTNTVSSVAFSRDSKLIASGSYDGTVRIWNASTGALAAVPLVGHIGGVTSVAFGPDSKFIISGSYNDQPVQDRALILWAWDDKNKKYVGKGLVGHPGGVASVAFSHDGSHMVSGAYDNTIRIWSISGEPIGLPLKGHTSVIASLAFSFDDKYIVSGSGEDDGTLRLWHNPKIPDLINWACAERYIRPLTEAEKAQYKVDNYPCAKDFPLKTANTPIHYTAADSSEDLVEPSSEVEADIRSETKSDEVGWMAAGGWLTQETGWMIEGGDMMNMLTSDRPFDLSSISGPELIFSSLLQGSSLATVQISPDGQNWSLLATVLPSEKRTETVIDLSPYAGQSVWLQFVWFYNPSGTVEAWRIGDIAVVDGSTRITLTPSATASPDITLTLVTTVDPNLTPSATLDITLTPTQEIVIDYWTATPEGLPLTLTAIAHQTLSAEATLTAAVPSPVPSLTPIPLSLPVYASMDDGAPGWMGGNGWGLGEGQSGIGWFFMPTESSQSVLNWLSPIDLQYTQAPQLHFHSRLVNAQSATVNISLDGMTWQPVGFVGESAEWTALQIDLSLYRGRVIYLQWGGVTPIEGQLAVWMIDNVSVHEAPAEPTLTPSMTETPTATATYTETATPSMTPSMTPTYTDIPTDVPTEIPIMPPPAIPIEMTPEATAPL